MIPVKRPFPGLPQAEFKSWQNGHPRTKLVRELVLQFRESEPGRSFDTVCLIHAIPRATCAPTILTTWCGIGSRRLDFPKCFALLKGGAAAVAHVHQQVEDAEKLLAEGGRHRRVSSSEMLHETRDARRQER